MSTQQLRIALPSKGMEEAALSFLKGCGLSVNRSNPRQYSATMRGLPSGQVEIVFQRAADIFSEVEEGTVDLGIAGYDSVQESRSEDDEIVMVHDALGFGVCALVLAVPEGWVDVTTMADVAEVAADLRASGRELRVATKYTNLTRQFLFNRGLTYFRLVEVSGAIEAAPSLNTADLISDLTSTGVTLRENRLKQIAGGTVLESQACLIGNKRILQSDPHKLEATRELLELIEAYLRSRQHVSLTANIRGESAEAVARKVTSAGDATSGLRGPTVARVYPKDSHSESDWFAVTVVVPEKVLLPTVEALRRAGASDVSATQVRFMFEQRSWRFDALKHQLDGRDSSADSATRTNTTARSSA